MKNASIEYLRPSTQPVKPNAEQAVEYGYFYTREDLKQRIEKLQALLVEEEPVYRLEVDLTGDERVALINALQYGLCMQVCEECPKWASTTREFLRLLGVAPGA